MHFNSVSRTSASALTTTNAGISDTEIISVRDIFKFDPMVEIRFTLYDF